MRYKLILFFLSILIGSNSIKAVTSRKNPLYEKYVQKYYTIAVKHQKIYGIPASITLAQGLLESGAGQSQLALKSNNHFGIKCHTDWSGSRVYHDDDLRGECFRKYKNPEASYEDHAKFLVNRPRYSQLFALDERDYRGWARGLQKCGYATDRAYANRLIKLIEDYELYRFDTAKLVRTSKNTQKNNSSKTTTQPKIQPYTIYKTFGLLYVYSNGRDDLQQIAVSVGFTEHQLEKFNEIPSDFPLKRGDVVYLQKKKKRADKPHYEHIVKIGESMHDISQRYGIQLRSLYKLNKKGQDYIPVEGEVLKLR